MTSSASALARRRRTVVAALAALVLSAAGCAGGGDDLARDAGPVHVHGLGVNPADSALYIATHTGLFRMESGSAEAERVGDRLQDTMGFAVVGPDRFLGSGHPDLRDELPPLLGLIESHDAGRSWQPVSLLGEADFHVLRASGPVIRAWDAGGERLMTSGDAGRTWDEVPSPGPLIDLVMDPGDPDHMVAATPEGLHASRDGGARWRPLGSAAPGLLAWPRANRLYLIEGDGASGVSRDGGSSWSPGGSLPGEPAAVTARDHDSLVVALHDGRLVHTPDGGRTWAPGAWET